MTNKLDHPLQTSPSLPMFDHEQLFDSIGCLTTDGLQALQADRLDDLGRLEAAEHLTFCDRCLARYTALLDSIRLSAPMRDLIPQVQALMRLRRFRVLTNRYVSMAAAIVLAFALWRFGAFGSLSTVGRRPSELPDAPRTSVSDMMSGALTSISQGLGDLLGELQTTVRSGWDQLADRSAPTPHTGE